MQVTGAQAFLEAIVNEGSEFAFGIPGTHILPVIELLDEEKRLKFVNVRHEAGAAAMADTYGRLTGKPGLCLVTAGPGATNSLTGVAHAFSAASPMVHVSGTVPVGSGVGTFHGVDDSRFLERMFEPVTKRSCSVRSVSEIPKTVHRCFVEASTGRRGPAHLSLPLNVLLAQGTAAMRDRGPRHRHARPNLAKVSRILSRCERPVILLGEEARCLRGQVERFAQRLQSPVMSTMNALGVFPQESPFFVGYIEQFWRLHPAALDVAQEADLVVSIGTRGRSPETECLRLVTDADWLFLNEERPEKNFSRATHLVGDIRSNLARLTNILQPAPQSRVSWASKAPAHKGAHLSELDEIPSRNSSSEPIHPSCAVQGLFRFLPSGGVLCSDSGANEVWVREYLGNRKNCEYLYSGTFGGMGFALPAAIAASLIRHDGGILAVSGDGGLLMSLMELSTFAEQKSRAVLVVLNDSAYGMMWLLQKHKTGSLLGSVNFAKIAEGFGIRSWRVEEPSELEGSYAEAFSVDGPAVVDVVTDYKQRLPHESLMEEFRRNYLEG